MRIMTAIMMTANGAAGAVLGVAGEAAFSRLPALLLDSWEETPSNLCFSQREKESTRRRVSFLLFKRPTLDHKEEALATRPEGKARGQSIWTPRV
jgi:hypothetical protein